VNVSLPETQKRSVELHKEGMNEEAPLHVVSNTVESVGRPWLRRNSRGFSRLPRAILNKTAQLQGFCSNFVSTLLSTLLLQELSSAPRVQATILLAYFFISTSSSILQVKERVSTPKCSAASFGYTCFLWSTAIERIL
jgi:hypothetical protein